MDLKEYEAFIAKIVRLHQKKGLKTSEIALNQTKNEIITRYQKQYNAMLRAFVTEATLTLGKGQNPTQAELGSLLVQMEQRLAILNQEVSEATLKGLRESYLTAHILHAKTLDETLTLLQLYEQVPYALLNHARFEAILSDTMDDLTLINAHAVKQLKKTVREIFQDQLVLATLNNTTNKEVVKAIESRLTKQYITQKITKQGLIGLIDKGGKRWNLKTYVEMAVDTKLQATYHEGLKDRGYQTGYDLVQVSEKGSKTPCQYFEGMVLSMTGQTEGYMTYEEAKATGMIFHPNCRHTCYPMTRFELLHDVDQQRHEQKMAGLEAGLQKYDRRNKKK